MKLTSVKIWNLAYSRRDLGANIPKLLLVMVKQLRHHEEKYSRILNRRFLGVDHRKLLTIFKEIE